MKKRAYQLIISTFLITIMISLASATWADNTREYKKEINISTSDTITRSELSVLITITYESHMKSDFSDLIFYDEEEDETLGYWFYNNNQTTSTSAQIWVKLNRNLSSTEQTKIYMYYGNSTANTESNIENAFIFADDFNEETINWNKWNTTNTALYNSGGGLVTMQTAGTSDQKLSSENLLPDMYSMESRIASDDVTSGETYILPSEITKNTFSGVESAVILTDKFRIDIDSGSTQIIGGESQNNTFYRMKWTKQNQSFLGNYGYVGEWTYDNGTQIIATQATSLAELRYLGYVQYIAGTATLDWVYVNQYIQYTPNITIGNEETRTTEQTQTEVESTTELYQTMNSAGAGLGIFIQTMTIALPTLLIVLAIITIIIVVGAGITEVIKKNITKRK